MEGMLEFPPVSAILGSTHAYLKMDDASKESANVQASAAALQVILNIHNTKNHHWTGARFALRDDKRNLLRAEVFIAAITGAFTALIKGGKFPNSRTSLSNNNIVIKAAEDAAYTKIDEIKKRKPDKRALEQAETANRQADEDGDDYNPGPAGGFHMNMNGSNSPKNSEPSDRDPDDDDDNANYTLAPNTTIQKNQYSFYPPIPERIDRATADAARATAEDAEKAKKRLSEAEIAAQFIYQPADPSVKDKRHPTIIEHECKTGIKNVVGTGLHGKLTRKDILKAAQNIDNLPENMKTLFMSDAEAAEYVKKKAAAAKAAAKAAEANLREKLRIAGGVNESEQENVARKPMAKPMTKATQAEAPAFDPQNHIMASSETPTPAPHNLLRKSKNRTVVPDSDPDDTPPPQNGVDIYEESLKARRARHESSHGSVRITHNGSPIASVPPHEYRLGVGNRFTSPPPDINDISRKLLSPPVPKKRHPLEMRQDSREDSGETEELTQRSPAHTSAPKPSVKSKTSSQSLKAPAKNNSNFSGSMSPFGGSLGEPSDDSALRKTLSATDAIASKKRRRESAQSQRGTPDFQEPPPPKRGQPFKLRQYAGSVRSASPAVSVVSTAASERPSRNKKQAQLRQSLPAQLAAPRHTSVDQTLAKVRAAKKAKATAKVKDEVSDSVSTRSSTTAAAAAAEVKGLSDEEKFKLPVGVTNEEFDVEAIVGHKVHENGQTYYHVKWMGYPESDNTWEPANNLYDAKKTLNDYRSSLHKRHQVEDVLSHRAAWRYVRDDSGQKRQKYCHEYLVKWKGSAKEYNSWEVEETIKSRGGIKPLLYYRIRKGVGFGVNGTWSKVKQAEAIRLVKEAGLQPEAGGRIKAADWWAAKGEDDDRHELALSAREESVYASAQEDYGMNQTI